MERVARRERCVELQGCGARWWWLFECEWFARGGAGRTCR